MTGGNIRLEESMITAQKGKRNQLVGTRNCEDGHCGLEGKAKVANTQTWNTKQFEYRMTS